MRSLFAHAAAQLDSELVDLHHRKQFFDCFGAHFGNELAGILAHQFPITLIGQQLALFQILNITRIDDDVGLEVEDLLEFSQRNIEQMPDTRRQALEEPDMRAGAGEIDVAQTLASHFGLSHFDAALVADHAAVLHAFVLTAKTFPIRDRTKDARAEQSIALRFEGAIVNRLGLGYFTVRPLTDLFR